MRKVIIKAGTFVLTNIIASWFIPKDILNTSSTITLTSPKEYLGQVKDDSGKGSDSLTKNDRDSQLYDDDFERLCQIKGKAFIVCLLGMQHDGTCKLRQIDDGKVHSTFTDDLLALILASKCVNQSFKAHLPQTNNQLRTSSNARNNATVQDDRVVVQDVRGRYNANNQGRPFQRNNARGNGVARNVGGQNRVGNMNPGQAKPIMCYNYKGIGHIARECPQPKQMLLMNAHENGAVLDEEQLLFLAGEQVTNFDDDVDDLALNVDHVFEADQCDAFDSDVDEAPTTQTMLMVNLSSEDPIYDEVGLSYDSNTPFEVQDHDTFVDHMDEYHEVHEMQSDVQYNSEGDQTSRGLSSELLGADVNDDNFAERMVALINQRKRAFAEQTAKEKRDKPMTPAQQREYMRVFVKNQSTTIYSTGWSMKYVKSLTDEQLIAEFEKIRMAVADLKSHELRRTLKRAGEALAPDTSKKQKSTEAPIPSVPDVPQLPVVSSPTSSGTRRKSLGRSRITKPKSILTELDLDVDDETFIKVVSDEDSEDEAPILWSAFAGWEVISTPLGEINALYMMDQSTKHFTTLREILHMVDRQDLLKLYGLVVKYYENHPVAGAGLVLWGDLQVLMDSQAGGKGSLVWNHQSHWQIRSWRLYTLSNVHVLETVSGEVLYMFADVSYPLSVKLMERMLKHKLEIDKDVVGNDMTTAEQLIRFIKNQLAAAQVSPA
ncbi:anticodon-binding aminoacyl-tRNA synthetase, class 1a [Tanacetum coccineum]